MQNQTNCYELSNEPRSARELFARFGIIPPVNREDWRLLPDNERKYGRINGLPSFVGKAIATNGILVALMTSTDLKIGHLDWFIPDETPKEVPIKQARTSARLDRIKREYL